MSYKIKPASVIEMDLGLEPYGEAHNKFAQYCRERMKKYTPNSTGNAEQSSQLNTPKIDGECNIVYVESYAGYQYYGMRKDGTHIVKNYTTPGTGPYWDKVMMSIEKEGLEEDMQNWIEKRGKK